MELIPCQECGRVATSYTVEGGGLNYIVIWMILPLFFAALMFMAGMRLGGKRRVKALGQYPFWAAAVLLSWWWLTDLPPGMHDFLGLLWFLPTAVIGLSGLPAGIVYANRKRWRYASVFPTTGILLCLLLCFCIACCCIRKPEKPSGPHFSVLTYNVNWGGSRPDLTVKAILEIDADIVCLQETTPAWEQFLKPILEEKYPHRQFHHFSGAGGVAFFAKRPVQEKAYIGSRAGWFPGWVLVAETPVGNVQLLCVHLRPPLSERGSVSLSAYFSMSGIHLQEIKDLHAHLDREIPSIILGDFNESTSGSAVRWLKKEEMTDALPEFDPYTPTWEWQTKLGILQGQFDHILYSRDFHCLNACVPKLGASDHYPVFAVFEARQKQVSPEDEKDNGN